MKNANERGTSCTCTALLAVVLMARVSRGFDTSDYAYFSDSSGGFCPGALELWWYRVPFAGGVKRCGSDIIDGPPMPVKPPPVPTSTLTTTTVLTTVPGFQEEFEATCCTTLAPPTTDLPDYTTNPPYDYAWQTTTDTRTRTTTSTITSMTATTTTSTRTAVTTSSTTTAGTEFMNFTGNTTTSSTTTSSFWRELHNHH